MPPPALSPVASPFQPPLKKTSLETFIEGLKEGSCATPEDLRTAFDNCLTQLEKGSYFAHLAYQILQYVAATPLQHTALSGEQIHKLKTYYEENLTYTATRKGEESFVEPMRSAAAYYLLFIAACEWEIRTSQTQPDSVTQNFADQCPPERECSMVL